MVTPTESQVNPAAEPISAVPVVELDHVSRHFGDVVGVNDVSLRVPRGSVLGVIGPSGAGKTTMIRIISGGLTADEGLVRVLGEEPRRFGAGRESGSATCRSCSCCIRT